MGDLGGDYDYRSYESLTGLLLGAFVLTRSLADAKQSQANTTWGTKETNTTVEWR